MRKLLLKRLSTSDLTLFESHYRKTTGTKQKAFNLDRAVFVDELYPLLPEMADSKGGRIPLDLSIYGPGKAGLCNLQRKILKQQKNWRLDGELIYDPLDGKHRFDVLSKGDFAIFDLAGDAVPSAARLYLIAREHPSDKALHDVLILSSSKVLSAHRAMMLLNSDELSQIIVEADLEEGHPVKALLGSEALEDAVQGGLAGIETIRKCRQGRGVGRDEFDRGKKNAERIGRLGEEILNEYFAELLASGDIREFIWEADRNAISPYDFSLYENGTHRVLDAKSTSGDFKNPIHVSIAELYEMAEGKKPYDLYRLYEVKESHAKLRIMKNVKNMAISVLAGLNLPKGVSVDSVSIKPDVSSFDDEIEIDFSSDHEDRSY